MPQFLQNIHQFKQIKIKSAINAFAQDKSGNLWLSVKGEGLYILSKKKVISFLFFKISLRKYLLFFTANFKILDTIILGSIQPNEYIIKLVIN